MNSMTGFGRAEGTDQTSGLSLRAEMNSVNRKQFDLKVALPREMTCYEAELRTRIAAKVSRGALTFRVELNSSSASAEIQSVKLNTGIIESLVKSVEELKKTYPIKGELTADGLLAIPGILEIGTPDLYAETFHQFLLTITDQAIDGLLQSRHTEGERLKSDIASRIEFLKSKTDEIRKLVKDYPKEQYEKMRTRIQSAGFQAEANDERLLREFVIFADKCDVTEELTRLDSHFIHFHELMNGETSGRALDFLVQETFREINTLGNKAAGTEVSPRIVAMKTELEKIREQVQNIE